MVAYADTSFLVALYAVQTESPRALAYMQKQTTALPFAPFQRLELRNAIRLGVFQKQMSSDQARQALREIESDLSEGILSHTPLAWTDVLQKAEELSAAHSETMGTRSLDILHVACALQNKASTFLTFDDRQRGLVEKSGLKIGI
jgi:predicted nucleic acid-binding protein